MLCYVTLPYGYQNRKLASKNCASCSRRVVTELTQKARNAYMKLLGKKKAK